MSDLNFFVTVHSSEQQQSMPGGWEEQSGSRKSFLAACSREAWGTHSVADVIKACVQALEDVQGKDLLFWANRYHLFVSWSPDHAHPWDDLPTAGQYVTLEIGVQRGTTDKVWPCSTPFWGSLFMLCTIISQRHCKERPTRADGQAGLQPVDKGRHRHSTQQPDMPAVSPSKCKVEARAY